MSARAYAVVMIRPGSPSTVAGAGIFGEPCPTTTNRLVPVELFHEDAPDFATASKVASLALSAPYYDWCGEVKHDPHRGIYREARSDK